MHKATEEALEYIDKSYATMSSYHTLMLVKSQSNLVFAHVVMAQRSLNSIRKDTVNTLRRLDRMLD